MTEITDSNNLGGARSLLLWAAGLVALPFLAGAIALAWQFARLPESAGNLAKAQLLQALLFAFGFALGLAGTAFALACRPRHIRILGTATALFGCAHIALAFVVRGFVEDYATGSRTSLVPFIIPAALWVYSVVLAIRVPGEN
jgi:hypothetical protein